MLAIRLQRVGRTGYATYRLAVQEASRHPSSGRVVAYVGIYNPHTKEAKVQVELAQKYLDNGAQPTPRVVKLLKDAGVKLPNWVQKFEKKTKTTRNGEKLRKNRPAVAEKPVVEAPEEPTDATDEPIETVEEVAESATEDVVVAEPSETAETEAPIESEPAE